MIAWIRHSISSADYDRASANGCEDGFEDEVESVYFNSEEDTSLSHQKGQEKNWCQFYHGRILDETASSHQDKVGLAHF